MKKLILISFLFVFGIGFSQSKNEPQSIISNDVGIKKYHNKEELDRMEKGELLGLYIERIESLVKTLPYIAFATKPGKTMSTFGIPNTKENRNTLEDKVEATNDFLENTIEFQKKMLPYSDKSNLIAAILFYEQTMKSLHEYSEFN
ncbi:MAG: hypothetical protein R2816_07400 [Flavobacteriaceae bacterium]|jgi:hypothetical protein|nr:hypothetical protein [Flavobacteriaceae bacterium]